MHLSRCLHPKIVKNKYTGKIVVSDCGKCEACLRRRQVLLCSKFEAECQCWPYSVFFTLTYDVDFVPQMYRDLENHCYVVRSTGECFDYQDLVIDERNFNFILDSPVLPYLRKSDAQNFIKRFRKICYTNIPENEFNKVRYAIIGEYGETTARPHMHGILWFSSQWLASHIEECISQAWSLCGESLGRTDCSFVRSRAPQYVSTYLTSFCDLPQIYQHKSIKPFCLYSKCPSVGSLFPGKETFEEILFNGSPRFFCGDERDGKPVYVPLWKDIESSLFPKVTGFGYLSHSERVRLYGIYNECPEIEFDSFRSWCEGFSGQEKSSDFLSRYFAFLFQPLERIYPCDFSRADKFRYNVIRRLWYVSRRVIFQSAIFKLSVSEYVTKIENYYSKKELDRLREWYNWQSEYVKQHDVRDLLFSDLSFVHNLVNNVNIKTDSDLTFEQKLVLKNYGYDSFSDFVGYNKKINGLKGTFDFRAYTSMLLWQNKKNKSLKRQNEYLEKNRVKHLNLYHFYHYGKFI